jgi:hypothetical protein
VSLLNEQSVPQREARNWTSYLVAGGAVVLFAVLLVIFGGHRHSAVQPGGVGLAPAASYAANLSLSNIKMSESSNLVGGKVTYLDGTILNKGSETLRAVTVQVGFLDDTHLLAQKETLALKLIRTHQPYIDTEPVSAAPIRPGESREFRLIFDSVPATWDGAYPEVRVIAVETK